CCTEVTFSPLPNPPPSRGRGSIRWRGRGRRKPLLDAHDFLCALPEAFEVVVRALLQREEMRDHRPHVDQHPAALRAAFLAEREVALGRARIERVDERAELTLVV